VIDCIGPGGERKLGVSWYHENNQVSGDKNKMNVNRTTEIFSIKT